MNIDRAWFRQNPSTNFRVRRPAAGEVEDLIRRQVPAAGYEPAAIGSVYPPPSPDVEWRILVVKVDHGALVRMVVLRDRDTPDTLGPEGAGTALAVVLGHRLVLDKRAA